MKVFMIFSFLVIFFPPGNAFCECITGDCINGQGIMAFPDGSQYEGQWKDKRFDGQGTLSLPDGGILTGLWKDGQFNGHGTMIYTYGRYEGQWKDGMKDGQGIMIFPDGSRYEGQWRDDKINGQGTYTYPNGGAYTGQWKDGTKNGQGTYTSPDNYKYIGQFKNGMSDGQGAMFFPDGSKYVGQWKDEKRNGQGVMAFSDGSQYEGQWRDDKINGQGTYTYPDGGKYVGQWKNGTKNGQGTYTSPDNYNLVCEFKNGKPDGQGVMILPDGSRYEGQLKDGKFVKGLASDKKAEPGQEKTAEAPTVGPETKVETQTFQQKGMEKSTPPDLGVYPYTIHVSSYQNREKSNRLAMELLKKGIPAFTSPAHIPGKGDYYRLFIGYYKTLDEAQKSASRFRGQKDLSPLPSKMPFAIQIGTFDSDPDLQQLESALQSKAYLAYSIPDISDNSKTRLLTGAFRTEEEAKPLSQKLQEEGFKAEVVRR